MKINLQLQNLREPLTIPFPDDSILANLDNIISMFQKSQQPSENDLTEILNCLKTVKVELTTICDRSKMLEERSSQDEVSSVDDSSNYKTEWLRKQSGDSVVRSSIEMLKNGGRFTKPIDKISSDEKSKNSKETVVRKSSLTSLRKVMNISSCVVTHRKSPTNLTRKASKQKLIKRAEQKVKKKAEEDSPKAAPRIVGTCYATCRIHSYEDASHTFEILKPNRVNSFDTGDTSDIVICVLANGQTALFTSKASKSLASILLFGESQ